MIASIRLEIEIKMYDKRVVILGGLKRILKDFNTGHPGIMRMKVLI